MKYYAVIRSTDHLAHYGIKGMKWGVRKAVVLGNEKKLDQHFKKAAKKLAKLQDKALHSGKYAAKAAGYGAAAVATGAIAIGPANSAASSYLKKRFATHSKTYNLGKNMAQYAEKYYKGNNNMYNDIMKKARGHMTTKNAVGKAAHDLGDIMKKHDTKIRIGAGIATAGLGALAAKNAYTATHRRKYMDQAESFKRSMDDAFAGTKYQGQYVAQPRIKKRKKRG